MIAVGVLGFPFIGALQEKTASAELSNKAPAIAQTLLIEKNYLLGEYKAIDPEKKAVMTEPAAVEALAAADKAGQFGALGKMVMFPAFMLACYLGIYFYFKSRGGYKAVDLHGSH
jgi:hypothetical protein